MGEDGGELWRIFGGGSLLGEEDAELFLFVSGEIPTTTIAPLGQPLAFLWLKKKHSLLDFHLIFP